MTEIRKYGFGDRLLEVAGNALYTLFAEHTSSRPMPGGDLPDRLEGKEKKFVGALMRVNHVGELAAQGLYYGQMIFVRDEKAVSVFRNSGEEEKEHLAWCEQRLAALGARTSRLSFFWYSASIVIGMTVSLVNDSANFGFVKEVETQVMEHLQTHLRQLPKNDETTRKLLLQMYEDEEKHAIVAGRHGAAELPLFVRMLMKAAAKTMTTTARYI